MRVCVFERERGKEREKERFCVCVKFPRICFLPVIIMSSLPEEVLLALCRCRRCFSSLNKSYM